MKYEDTVRTIFCTDAWRDLGEDERDGGYGVACVMAFVDGGIRANVDDIAYYLDADPLDIEVPFRRLAASGVFSMRFNARKDKALNGYDTPNEGKSAWCHIAAIAQGWIGQGYYIQRQTSKPEQVTRQEEVSI
jgi:hypothetical protein